MESVESIEYRSKLIDLVRQHGLLWHRGNKFSCNRILKMEAWNEVARELEKTPEQVRRNWQNLRDQYRRELRRQLQYNAETTWIFYDKMSFIREFLRSEYHSDNQESNKTFSDSESDLDANNKDLLKAFGQPVSEIDGSQTSNTTDTEMRPIPKEPDIPTAMPKPEQHIASASKRRLTKYKRHQSNQNSPYPHTIGPLILAINTNAQQQQNISYSKYNNSQDNQLQSEAEQSVPCDSFEDKELSLKIELDSDDEEQSKTGAQLESIGSINETNECKTNEVQHELTNKSNECETSENSRSDHSNRRTSESQRDENEASRHVAIGQEDDDYYFVLSLLPYLRQVKMDRKLKTRVNILKVVMENLD